MSIIDEHMLNNSGKLLLADGDMLESMDLVTKTWFILDNLGGEVAKQVNFVAYRKINLMLLMIPLM